jgi:hypothetical protein
MAQWATFLEDDDVSTSSKAESFSTDWTIVNFFKKNPETDFDSWQKQEFFSSSPSPDQVGGATNLQSSWYRGFFPGGDADHIFSSSTKDRNSWSYNSNSLHVFMSWCLIRQRDNFAF